MTKDKVICEVEEVDLQGDFGSIPSVRLTCTRCDHVTEAYGTGEPSIRRCLAMMREECPQDEQNWYTIDDLEDA